MRLVDTFGRARNRLQQIVIVAAHRIAVRDARGAPALAVHRGWVSVLPARKGGLCVAVDGFTHVRTIGSMEIAAFVCGGTTTRVVRMVDMQMVRP